MDDAQADRLIDTTENLVKGFVKLKEAHEQTNKQRQDNINRLATSVEGIARTLNGNGSVGLVGQVAVLDEKIETEECARKSGDNRLWWAFGLWLSGTLTLTGMLKIWG